MQDTPIKKLPHRLIISHDIYNAASKLYQIGADRLIEMGYIVLRDPSKDGLKCSLITTITRISDLNANKFKII
jgi:hypothetical protein